MDSRAWDERYAGADLVWSATPNQFVASALADHKPGHKPGRAVDLAAGEGRNALWLASRGWDVTAVDFSPVGLDKGRALGERLGVAVTWVCADVLAWSPPEPVDLVVVAYLQLPAEQRRAAVRRAYDALRPGGELFWVAHDSTNLTEGTGGPQDPRVLMTVEDLLDDLEGLPVEVVRAERVSRVVAVEGADEHRGEASRTAYDCLLHARRA